MSEKAIQIYLKEIYFDGTTAQKAVWAYVVSIVRANTSGDAQVYITNPAFRTTKRDGKRASEDCAYIWDGAGKLVFSAPAGDFDSVDIDLYFIRDRSKVREAGELLEELFSDKGAGTEFLDGVAKVGAEVMEQVVDTVAMVQPAGQILKLGGAAAKIIGVALQNKGDRTMIHASGTLTREQLTQLTERYSDKDPTEALPWGRNRGDKGYFHIDIVQRDVADASKAVTMVEFPKVITERLDHAISKRTGMGE
jgi:hypothetical protein